MPSIQQKRGLFANLPSSAKEGEFLYTTDENRLYIGTGSGTVPLKIKPEDVIGLLTGGKINSDLMPEISISDVVAVDTISERDALGVQVGDVAVVLDNGNGSTQSFMYSGSEWIAITVPGESGGSISTVNGDAGPNVVLDTDDIEEGSTNLYYTSERVGSYIATMVNENDGIAGLDANGKLSIDVFPSSVVRSGDNATRLGSGGSSEGSVFTSDGSGNTEWRTTIDAGSF